MAIRQSDIKLLWGRSGNRCAICRQELSIDPQHSSATVPLGEQAHIIAKAPEGPRGESILTSEERDAYDNLILVCPTDHVRIDKSPQDYPVEKLHLLKTHHELWVQSTLGGDPHSEMADQVYAALLDSFVEDCDANNWADWTSLAIEVEPLWDAEMVEGTWRFSVAVVSAAWPGIHEELERALMTLGRALREARATFLKHASLEEYQDMDQGRELSRYRGKKFYKELRVWDEIRYKQLFEEWQEWQTKSQALIFEATRAANWVADCARRSINPGFFAVAGKFRLFPTFRSDIPGDLWVPEYANEERQSLPKVLPERVARYRELFPFKLGPDD